MEDQNIDLDRHQYYGYDELAVLVDKVVLSHPELDYDDLYFNGILYDHIAQLFHEWPYAPSEEAKDEILLDILNMIDEVKHGKYDIDCAD